MSWSVSHKGTPAEAKKALATQFEAAKRATESIPTEQRSVALAEETCNLLLNYLIESGFVGVSVSGYGSGCKTQFPYSGPDGHVDGWQGNVSYSLTVTPLHALEP